MDIYEKFKETIDEYHGICDIPPKHIKKYGEIYGYGMDQLDILQEECAELIQAISKFKREKEGSRDKIVEEMTHVAISSEMCCRVLDISKEEILREVRRKDTQIVLNDVKNGE